jgi:hypothetical protein
MVFAKHRKPSSLHSKTQPSSSNGSGRRVGIMGWKGMAGLMRTTARKSRDKGGTFRRSGELEGRKAATPIPPNPHCRPTMVEHHLDPGCFQRSQGLLPFLTNGTSLNRSPALHDGGWGLSLLGTGARQRLSPFLFLGQAAISPKTPPRPPKPRGVSVAGTGVGTFGVLEDWRGK